VCDELIKISRRRSSSWFRTGDIQRKDPNSINVYFFNQKRNVTNDDGFTFRRKIQPIFDFLLAQEWIVLEAHYETDFCRLIGNTSTPVPISPFVFNCRCFRRNKSIILRCATARYATSLLKPSGTIFALLLVQWRDISSLIATLIPIFLQDFLLLSRIRYQQLILWSKIR
jgi:hypothetical protein